MLCAVSVHPARAQWLCFACVHMLCGRHLLRPSAEANACRYGKLEHMVLGVSGRRWRAQMPDSRGGSQARAFSGAGARRWPCTTT